jgi:hypothetical protein
MLTIFEVPAAGTSVQALHDIFKSSSERFIIGTNVQDPSILQITAEQPFDSSSRDDPSILPRLHALKVTTTLVDFKRELFALKAPPIVEYVRIEFPAWKNPGFEKGIEEDFARFEEIMRRRGKMEDLGEVFLETGWTLEYNSYTSGIQRMKSFVVVRGWESMEKFLEAVATEEFKEAVPILMGWGMPYKLVCLNDASEGFG